MLDLRTLLVAYSVTIVILSMAILLAARSQRRFPGLEYWSLGGLLVGSVPLQIVSQGAFFGFPNPITMSMGIIGGMVCLSVGMARYTGQPVRYRFYAGVFLVWLTALVAGITTNLPLTYTVAAMATLVAATAVDTARQLLRRRQLAEMPAHRITAYLFLALAVGALIRAVFVILFGIAGPRIGGFASLQPIGLLGFQAMHTAVGLSLLVMVWARLDRELQAHVGTLEEELGRDPLTGALNRRGLRDCAEPLIEQSLRYAQPFSVICLDIDHFKRVNDSYGHGVGDEVLKVLVGCVRDHLRSSDHVARLGGEEFAVILPGTSLRDAVTLAERLRTAASGCGVPVSAGALHFTCSFGVAERLSDEDGLAAILSRADHALYEAKHSGRDQVRQAMVPAHSSGAGLNGWRAGHSASLSQ